MAEAPLMFCKTTTAHSYSEAQHSLLHMTYAPRMVHTCHQALQGWDEELQITL